MFNLGDFVYLKLDNSPQMLVDDLEPAIDGAGPARLSCVWFDDNGDFHREWFRPSSLEPEEQSEEESEEE